MIKIKRHLTKSLPARLLLVFIIISISIVILVISAIAGGLSYQWKDNIRPHLFQYLSYVNTDIGNPPDVNKAEKLSKQLAINIYISGNNTNYSSTGIPLNLGAIEFDDEHHRRRWDKQQYPLLLDGQKISFGEHGERAILRSQIGDYQVYYELPHQQSQRSKFLITTTVVLLLIIGFSYFILRRMLQPIQDISRSVKKMGQGDLSSRVATRSNNDLGELAKSINTMAEDIENMLDAKRQLLLAVSHELRSPLTRAKIATQMLEKSNNQTRIQEDLQEMEHLITEILEAERINGPHAVLQKKSVDMQALIQSVLTELPVNQVNLKLTSPVTIDVDETRIRLLIRNLLLNAIDYSKGAKMPPEVHIKPNKQEVTIKVVDYGPGIPSAELNKITEPFYRPDPSRTRETGGLGIGLYLCKLIVEAHKGKLQIESELGQGTRVSFTLPYTV